VSPSFLRTFGESTGVSDPFVKPFQSPSTANNPKFPESPLPTSPNSGSQIKNLIALQKLALNCKAVLRRGSEPEIERVQSTAPLHAKRQEIMRKVESK
jgi:hypothetical protein